MINYGINLINFYVCEDNITIVLEEANEQSETNDKDASDKEDTKEKDKISQDHIIKQSGLADVYISLYPHFYSHNTSVYLEFVTPPPEFS